MAEAGVASVGELDSENAASGEAQLERAMG